MHYTALTPWDVSSAFATQVRMAAHAGMHETGRREQAAVSKGFMRSIMDEYGITDENLVKPGIGESTRVLLRRAPRLVLVPDEDSRMTEHLHELAAMRGAAVRTRTDLPCEAVAIVSDTNTRETK